VRGQLFCPDGIQQGGACETDAQAFLLNSRQNTPAACASLPLSGVLQFKLELTQVSHSSFQGN